MSIFAFLPIQINEMEEGVIIISLPKMVWKENYGTYQHNYQHLRSAWQMCIHESVSVPLASSLCERNADLYQNIPASTSSW